MTTPTLPPPLMTSEPRSFARATIVERKPLILRQVIQDNAYPAEIEAALQALEREIRDLPMRPLVENAADVEAWNAELARYAGNSWLAVPWYWAEVFFYRKLLEAVRYLQPGPQQSQDPFARQKRQQEAAAMSQLAQSWGRLDALPPAVVFEALLHSALWGNRADLSNFTVQEAAQAGLAAREERQWLLIDHTQAVHRRLATGVARVDFINDNVGLDSLFDLALADFLLRHGWARQVVMHLKDRPFFVSDAMIADIVLAMAALRAAAEPALQALGQRLEGYRAAGHLRLQTDPFWTSWKMFREFPPTLQEDIGRSDLVIIKGDVNYRRLLDDRHWPYDTPLEAITPCFPAPFVALRTLKGEIMVGLRPGQADQLTADDPTWLINGKRGLIQFVAR